MISRSFQFEKRIGVKITLAQLVAQVVWERWMIGENRFWFSTVHHLRDLLLTNFVLFLTSALSFLIQAKSVISAFFCVWLCEGSSTRVGKGCRSLCIRRIGGRHDTFATIVTHSCDHKPDCKGNEACMLPLFFLYASRTVRWSLLQRRKMMSLKLAQEKEAERALSITAQRNIVDWDAFYAFKGVCSCVWSLVRCLLGDLIWVFIMKDDSCSALGHDRYLAQPRNRVIPIWLVEVSLLVLLNGVGMNVSFSDTIDTKRGKVPVRIQLSYWHMAYGRFQS